MPAIGVTHGVEDTVQRSLFGVPVLVDSAMIADLIGIWDTTAIAVALRRDVKVESDTSRYFDSDSVAVRATLRADWTVLDPTRQDQHRNHGLRHRRGQ